MRLRAVVVSMLRYLCDIGNCGMSHYDKALASKAASTKK